ncbi:unnamed protein product [Moneuplotes crassus]|uniref:Uncharacterized protein n=1 Tax=Euplotes crassus TaxID=5936 RepID=A0AAD1UB75_EUPCR|nr:unnamed protein product [Moneuplotes crassus]
MTNIVNWDYYHENLKHEYLFQPFGLFISKFQFLWTKIIQQKGFETYQERFSCILTRIGLYFMPTFVDKSISHSSEFDEIIHTFSEQLVNLGINWASLFIYFIIFMALACTNCFGIILFPKGWKETKKIYPQFSEGMQSNQRNGSSSDLNQLLDEENEMLPVLNDYFQRDDSNPLVGPNLADIS